MGTQIDIVLTLCQSPRFSLGVNTHWMEVLSYPEDLGLNDLRSAGSLLLSIAEQLETRETGM